MGLLGGIGDAIGGIVDTVQDGVEAVTTAIKDLTPEEIDDLMEQLKTELLRRQNIDAYQREQTKLQEQFRESGMLPVPTPEAPWAKPAESVDAYGVDDIVTHGGARRMANAGMVVCEPTCTDHWTDAPG